MGGEIAKRENGRDAVQALRVLLDLKGEEVLAIAKTALRDGTYGLAARAISVAQRWNERRFCEAFLGELQEMVDAGAIREDFPTTDAGASSWQEFFEMVGGKPDEEKFQTFCALFMSANAPQTESATAIVDLELMRSINALSAGELHLLMAMLKVKSFVTGNDVISALGKHLGYGSRALIDKNIKVLIEHGLISEFSWKAMQGPAPGQHRELLTDLGAELLRRIEGYEGFKRRS